MDRRLARAAALLAGWLASAPAHAQSEWTQLPCGDAYLAYGGGGTCSSRVRDGRTATGATLSSRPSFSFQELTPGRRVSMVLQYSSTSFQAYSSQVSERALRDMVGSSGSGWGSYAGFGNTGYIGFRREGWHCVAIDHADAAYRWILRGSVCQPTAMGDMERSVKAILAATRVGSASAATNALGSAVEAPR